MKCVGIGYSLPIKTNPSILVDKLVIVFDARNINGSSIFLGRTLAKTYVRWIRSKKLALKRKEEIKGIVITIK